MAELLLQKNLQKDSKQRLVFLSQPDTLYTFQSLIITKISNAKPRTTKVWIRNLSNTIKPLKELQQQLLRRNIITKTVTRKFFGLIPVARYSVLHRTNLEEIRESLRQIIMQNQQATDTQCMILSLLRSGKQLPVVFQGMDAAFYSLAEDRILGLQQQTRDNALEKLIAEDEAQNRKQNEVDFDYDSVGLFLDLVHSFDSVVDDSPATSDDGFDSGTDSSGDFSGSDSSGGDSGGGGDGGGSD